MLMCELAGAGDWAEAKLLHATQRSDTVNRVFIMNPG
jgi:hypothetical protein